MKSTILTDTDIRNINWTDFVEGIRKNVYLFTPEQWRTILGIDDRTRVKAVYKSLDELFKLRPYIAITDDGYIALSLIDNLPVEITKAARRIVAINMAIPHGTKKPFVDFLTTAELTEKQHDLLLRFWMVTTTHLVEFLNTDKVMTYVFVDISTQKLVPYYFYTGVMERIPGPVDTVIGFNLLLRGRNVVQWIDDKGESYDGVFDIEKRTFNWTLTAPSN